MAGGDLLFTRPRAVTAVFTDGSSASGDALVGADGTWSAVRKQRLRGARIINTGLVGAACKLPLMRIDRTHLPAHLLTRLTSVLPKTTGYMIVTQSIHKPSATFQDPIGDHLIWVLLSSPSPYGNADPKELDGGSLAALALELTKTWHPILRELIACSDRQSIATIPVLTSVPVKPWKPSTVTLLGDAIHTMTPLQGLGGSTALRDASLLCRSIVEADSGGVTPVAAIRRYEHAMIEYGFAAVRQSACFGALLLAENWLLRSAFKTALRVVMSTPPLKHRVFRSTL